MDAARVDFADGSRPERSGALVLDTRGIVTLEVSPALGSAMAADEPDLAPFQADDARRGRALAVALRRGVASTLLEAELASGSFELGAYIDGARVRLTLRPGDMDPDEAWEFLMAMNDARLAVPRA